MLQPNLGLYSQHCLGSITETIQIFIFFSSYKKMWKVWRDKMKVGVWWGLEKGSSISVSSASDCLEQTHLSCKRHSSWESIYLFCNDISALMKVETAFREKQTCAKVAHALYLHYAGYFRTQQRVNGARLKQVHESPLLVYVRTAPYYCSVRSNDKTLLQMSLKWSVLGGSLFKLHNKTDKEINFTLRNDHNKSPKYKSANSDIYTFF